MATMDVSDPRWFVDANILVFAANPLSPWHTTGSDAVASRAAGGDFTDRKFRCRRIFLFLDIVSVEKPIERSPRQFQSSCGRCLVSVTSPDDFRDDVSLDLSQFAA